MNGRGVVVSLLALAMVSGCSTPTQSLDSARGAMPQIARHASGGDVLFYSFDKSSDSQGSIYDYSKGESGGNFTISPSMRPGGICSDGTGDVFLTGLGSSHQAEVYEYTYGATSPTASQSLGSSAGTLGCSVDNTTGNVAALLYSASHSPVVEVLPNFQGPGAIYSDHLIDSAISISYDGSGNLFFLGVGKSRSGYLDVYVLAELPQGAKKFKQISMKSIDFSSLSPIKLQWDGTYLTIEVFENSAEKFLKKHHVDRLTISGSQAKLVDTLYYKAWHGGQGDPTWIQPKLNILVVGEKSGGAVYQYENGGAKLGTFGGTGFKANGITVADPQ